MILRAIPPVPVIGRLERMVLLLVGNLVPVAAVMILLLLLPAMRLPENDAPKLEVDGLLLLALLCHDVDIV